LTVFVKRVLKKMTGFMGETNKHGDKENGTTRTSSICSAQQTVQQGPVAFAVLTKRYNKDK